MRTRIKTASVKVARVEQKSVTFMVEKGKYYTRRKTIYDLFKD